MAEGLPGLMDGQALDNVHEAPSVDSLASTQAVGVPETQDPPSLLDSSGGSDMAVIAQSTVAPHPEQLDGAPSGPFEVPESVDAQSELAASAPPSEEGVFVVSPSSSAPAVPDSSVVASSSSSDTSVAAPPTELATLDEEQPTDHSPSPDVPASVAPEESTTSSASIVERSLTQEDHSFGDPRVTGVEDTHYDSATQVQFEGPSSSDTGTLVSRSTVSTYDEPNQSPIKAEAQRGVRTPSANRLSISYAAGTKRLVINAEIVEKFKILRSDGRVEILLRVEKDDANELNGIIVGSLT
jgi:20S proteasome subunit alpha 6